MYLVLFFILLILFLFYKKFSNKISEAFKDYKYTAVIIEPREHAALEYVLENFNDNLSDDTDDSNNSYTCLIQKIIKNKSNK